MKVIILAGGKGTRLSQSAKNIPKPLVEVAGKPILQHQIDLLAKHDLNDIRFSLGYEGGQIIDYLNGKYEYIIEEKPLGTGGAIKFASKDLKDDFMVLNGDILSNVNFSELITNYRYNVSRETLGIITAYYCKNTCDFGMLTIKDQKITEFLEKPVKKRSGYINTGFYVLSSKIFNNVSRETFSIETDIFPKLAKKGQLIAYIHKGFWTDLGTETRLKQAKKKLETC